MSNTTIKMDHGSALVMQDCRRSASRSPSVSSIEYLTISPTMDQLSLSSPINPSRSLANNNLATCDQSRKAEGTTKAARRIEKARRRREARLGPDEAAAHYQKVAARNARQRRVKCSLHTLFKTSCMKRELKRAMGTKISHPQFSTIDVHTPETSHVCEQMTSLQTRRRSLDFGVFAGQIIIQDSLNAMTQALSEHTMRRPRRLEPGRHAFYVDAALSHKYDHSGVGVVHKTNRQDWASPWTVHGYRIEEKLDRTDAGLWAIWQAMEMVLEKVYTDSGHDQPPDECYNAIIYSDCEPALQLIRGTDLGRRVVEQTIVSQSQDLMELGVNVELHWCPGRKKVPGNELAHHLAKEVCFHPNPLTLPR